jgi:hypothetical protein
MYNTILLKHGLQEQLPDKEKKGNLLYTIDTHELYIGDGVKKPVRKIHIINPDDEELTETCKTKYEKILKKLRY